MNAPKKIWVDDGMIAWAQYSEDDTPYIREDVVLELVEALVDATDAMTAFAELNRDTAKAKAVLAKLEESHE